MNYEKMRDFYCRLADEESKMIFRQRLQYLFTGDRSHLQDMMREVKKLHFANRQLYTLVEKSGGDASPVVLYGAGMRSESILLLCSEGGLTVAAFCDSDHQKIKEQNGLHLGLPLISRETLLNDAAYAGCGIIVTSLFCKAEIKEQLMADGVSEERISCDISPYLEKQYYDPEILRAGDDEIFIDVGCLNGYTIKKFVDFCSGKYKKIYGFEPMPDNYRLTMDNLKKWDYDNVEILRKGAWSVDCELSFIVAGGGSKIKDTRADEKKGTEITIQTATIDSVIGDEMVTFIKMDIEGAELEALKGARETIQRCKPKLAICLYHKAEDIIEIPYYLQSLDLGYRFYIRHYKFSCNNYNDTILYAV